MSRYDNLAAAVAAKDNAFAGQVLVTFVGDEQADRDGTMCRMLVVHDPTTKDWKDGARSRGVMVFNVQRSMYEAADSPQKGDAVLLAGTCGRSRAESDKPYIRAERLTALSKAQPPLNVPAPWIGDVKAAVLGGGGGGKGGFGGKKWESAKARYGLPRLNAAQMKTELMSLFEDLLEEYVKIAKANGLPAGDPAVAAALVDASGKSASTVLIGLGDGKFYDTRYEPAPSAAPASEAPKTESVPPPPPPPPPPPDDDDIPF